MAPFARHGILESNWQADERGYDVEELFREIKAWKTLHFPIEPADAEALARQSAPI